MVEQNLSLIRFGLMNFWGVLINSRPLQPISTLLIKLVESLISCEPEPDKKMLARLKWIYEHTHEDIDAHLSVVELIVFKNIDKGISKEIDIGHVTVELSKLYYILDEISKELSVMTIDIAKKYNMDMPVFSTGMNNAKSISIE